MNVTKKDLRDHFALDVPPEESEKALDAGLERLGKKIADNASKPEAILPPSDDQNGTDGPA